jgi:alpha-L-fucosidase
MNSVKETRNERMAWWHDEKFGMFVHWGLFSHIGRGEQVLARDLMPLEEYEAHAADFKPDPEWAGRIAEQAVASGATYVVLTTRHHDGYCLWDTGTHEYNAPNTGPGRDLVREFTDTMRKHGLRVGLYYSVVNWRWKGYWDPEAYPEDLPKIVDEMHAQVTELMTHYGKIDIL